VQSPFVLTDTGGARTVGRLSAASRTPSPERNFAALGFGVQVAIGPHFSALLDYETHLSSDDVQHFASVRGSWRF
jgi:uncharacterized protein with beta-barrel porin domain